MSRSNQFHMKAIVILIFALLLLKNCAHSQKLVEADPSGRYPRIESMWGIADDVLELFGVVPNPQHGFPLDALYVSPTEDNLNRMRAFYRNHRCGEKYLDNAWDCDDMATEATYWARRWGRTYYKGVPASIAFGTVYVRIVGNYPMSGRLGMDASPSKPILHALNIYRRNDGQWFFFEPQTGCEESARSIVYEGNVEVIALSF